MTATKTNRWTYPKDGGEKYPVQPGQVWRVGEHTFVCSDLIETRLFDETLAAVGAPDLVYVDPPWNPSNLSSFRTKAAKDRADYTIWQLYARVFGIHPEVPHFVEGGIKEALNVKAQMPEGHHVTGWRITYYRKHPCVLHYVGTTPPPANLPDLNGVDDDYTPDKVMKAYGSGLVVDPCAGRGLTARTAARNGWRSVTNEMSPWRMSAAMTSVSQITGDKPERIK